MTIDEAIAHAEWAANNCEGECSEEHRQLAEWLRELVALRAAHEELWAFVLAMYQTACGVYAERMQFESSGK